MPRDTEERPGSLGPSVCCVFPAPLHVVWKLPRENGGCSLWTESSFLLTDQVIWLLRPSEKISLSLAAASKFSRIRGGKESLQRLQLLCQLSWDCFTPSFTSLAQTSLFHHRSGIQESICSLLLGEVLGLEVADSQAIGSWMTSRFMQQRPGPRTPLQSCC